MNIPDEVVDAVKSRVRTWLIERDWVGTDGHISDAYMAVVDETMRAAADVLTPVVLAKALAEPSDAELTACVVSDTYGGHDGCVTKAFANRLRSLQAKPDPRVALIMEELRERDISTDDRTFTERILNALDQYDRRGATK